MLTLAIGALIAIQPATNNMLSKHTGALVAAFASLLTATLIIAAILAAAGDVSRLGDLDAFRPVHLLGGIGGAAIVGGSILLIRPLGATALTAGLVTTQLTMSALMDRGGWFGVDQEPLTATVVLGIVLLVGGTILVTVRP
jgi:transporter family-2 protein